MATYEAYDVSGNLLTRLDSDPNGNEATIRSQAQTALATNRTFVALASPTNAQVVAEVKALARQNNGLIRLLLNQLDGTD